MDGARFDSLMRSLLTEGPTRRGMLRAGAGAALATVFGRVAADDAAAARERCKNKPDLCKSMSERSLCKGEVCACLTTRAGVQECVDLSNAECPTKDECDSDDDCPGVNNLCFAVKGCCASPKNLCARRCGGGSGATASTTSRGGLPLLRRP